LRARRHRAPHSGARSSRARDGANSISASTP
jgi:hypothetical protein